MNTFDTRTAQAATPLPCPFCRGTNLMIDNFSGRLPYAVSCEAVDCSAIGPARKTKADAVAAWNEVAGRCGAEIERLRARVAELEDQLHEAWNEAVAMRVRLED